ncbi:hypothetical protein TNCV_383871 [Trichonephila clavipes]|nr:hypothetical protein TNCV_383871 [Trichonephila clavipes]
MHIDSVHSLSSYWTITWRDGMGCYGIPLDRTDSTLNNARYISLVLRLLSLPFIRALRNPTFQQDNTRPHVAGIVRTYLDTKNVRLLHGLHVQDISCQ